MRGVAGHIIVPLGPLLRMAGGFTAAFFALLWWSRAAGPEEMSPDFLIDFADADPEGAIVLKRLTRCGVGDTEEIVNLPIGLAVIAEDGGLRG